MKKKIVWISLSVMLISLAWCNNHTSQHQSTINTGHTNNIIDVQHWQHNIKSNWSLEDIKKEISDISNNTVQKVNNLQKDITNISQLSNNVKDKIEKQLKDSSISQDQKEVLQNNIKQLKRIEPQIKEFKNKLTKLEEQKNIIINKIQNIVNNSKQWKNKANIEAQLKQLKNKVEKINNNIVNTTNSLEDLTNTLNQIKVSTASKAYVKKINKKLNINHFEEKIKQLSVDDIQLKSNNELPKISDETIINKLQEFVNSKKPDTNTNSENMDKLWKICSIKPNQSNIIVDGDIINLKINNNTIFMDYPKWCKYYIIAKQLNYNLRFKFIKLGSKNWKTIYTLWWHNLMWDIYNIIILYFIKNNPKFLSNIIKQYWQGGIALTILYITQNNILNNFL